MGVEAGFDTRPRLHTQRPEAAPALRHARPNRAHLRLRSVLGALTYIISAVVFTA